MDASIKEFTIESTPSNLHYEPEYYRKYASIKHWVIEVPYGQPFYEPMDVLKAAIESMYEPLKKEKDRMQDLIFKVDAHIQMEFDDDFSRYVPYIVVLNTNWLATLD